MALVINSYFFYYILSLVLVQLFKILDMALISDFLFYMYFFNICFSYFSFGMLSHEARNGNGMLCSSFLIVFFCGDSFKKYCFMLYRYDVIYCRLYISSCSRNTFFRCRYFRTGDKEFFFYFILNLSF